MTLFEFLRKVRAEGADISKMKIRISNVGGGWNNGFQISTLRGNLLSINADFESDYQLHPGHLCMTSEVVGIRRAPMKRLSDVQSPIMIIDLMRSTAS